MAHHVRVLWHNKWLFNIRCEMKFDGSSDVNYWAVCKYLRLSEDEGLFCQYGRTFQFYLPLLSVLSSLSEENSLLVQFFTFLPVMCFRLLLLSFKFFSSNIFSPKFLFQLLVLRNELEYNILRNKSFQNSDFNVIFWSKNFRKQQFIKLYYFLSENNLIVYLN